MNIKEKAFQHRDKMVEIRRYMHKNPEPSMQEFNTTEYIRNILTEWGVEWIEAGVNGTVAILKGKNSGKTVGLRADIDALEMDELSPLEYASQNKGIMHACGHDGHAASLMGAILVLKDMEFEGTVKAIFQPGEENGMGARSVVDSGAVNDLDGVFAMHVNSGYPTGCATIKEGPMSAANDKYFIEITGLGCHGSTPERGADALLAGASLVQNLQAMMSHENSPLDPTVLTVGIFRSGTAFNILPESAYLEGSCRTLKKELREKNRAAIKRFAENTAAAFKCKAEVRFEVTADLVNNDPHLTNIARDCAREILGEDKVFEQPLSLGAEDFAAFMEIAPVTYLHMGSKNDNIPNTDIAHHHGLFDIDEDVLPLTASMYAKFAKEFLNKD